MHFFVLCLSSFCFLFPAAHPSTSLPPSVLFSFVSLGQWATCSIGSEHFEFEHSNTRNYRRNWFRKNLWSDLPPLVIVRWSQLLEQSNSSSPQDPQHPDTMLFESPTIQSTLFMSPFDGINFIPLHSHLESSIGSSIITFQFRCAFLAGEKYDARDDTRSTAATGRHVLRVKSTHSTSQGTSYRFCGRTFYRRMNTESNVNPP